jgi:hypothetical protein
MRPALLVAPKLRLFEDVLALIIPRVSALSDISPEQMAEFDAAARRPLAQRFRYSFVRTYKPVLDDAQYRSFDSMEEYRRWCEENLPDWLGYGRL